MSARRSTQQTRFKVEVTQADIERAERNHSYACVVVQAVARTIPDAHHIDVDIQTIRFTLGEERYAYLTPYSVQGYIVAFDAGDDIHPFGFQLRDPKRLKRRRKTEAGKAVARADNRTRRQPKKVRDKTGTSTSEVESVRAAYAGQKLQETTPGERVPPRVHKTSRRTYGSRILRLNRDAVEAIDQA